MQSYENEGPVRNPAEESERSLGPIFGGIIIMGILIAAGIFVLGEKTNTVPISVATSTDIIVVESTHESTTTISTNIDLGTTTPLSTSTDLNDIDTDLQGTDLNSINTQVENW